MRWVTEKEFRELVQRGESTVGVCIRKNFVAAVKAESDSPDSPLTFSITTATVDRMKDTIAVDGWETSNFRKNPVVLWAHDRSEPPVGKSIREWLADDALKSMAQFTPKDLYPFGAMVGEMYRKGFLSAVSVGFQPMTYEINKERGGDYGYAYDFKTQELLEYSAVPVPANPEALIEARAAGIDTAPMREWAEKILDGEGVLVLPRSVIEAAWKNAAPSTTFKDLAQPTLDAVKSLEATVAKLAGDVAKLTEAKAAPVAPPAPALTSSADVAAFIRRTAEDEVQKQHRRKTTGRLD